MQEYPLRSDSTAVVTEVVPVAPRVATDRTLTTADDPYASRRASAARLTQAINLIFGLIEGLLLIRFVLRALGANPDAGFAQAIYAVTGWLVAPFMGLFGTPQATNGAVFEVHTLTALLIYPAVGWLLTRAAWLMFGEGRSASRTSVITEQTRVM